MSYSVDKGRKTTKKGFRVASCSAVSDVVVADNACVFTPLVYVSGIVVVGINRPKAKNAISKNLVKLVCARLFCNIKTLNFGSGLFWV